MLNSFTLRLVAGCACGALLIGNLKAENPRTEAATVAREFTAADFWRTNHVVSQELDEALPGRITKFNEAGILVPASAVRVHFYRNGALAKSFRTDDGGYFQAVVPTGVYTVIAGDLGNEKGFAAASIRIVKYVAPPPIKVPPRQPLKGRAIAVEIGDSASQERKPPRWLEMSLIHPKDVAFLRDRIINRSAVPRLATVAKNSPAHAEPRNLATLLAGSDEVRRAVAPVVLSRTLRSELKGRISETPFDGPWHFNHEMYVDAGGVVVGNVRVLGSDGLSKPVADAEILYIHRHQVQSRALGDQNGGYQAGSITPGVYSVIIITPKSFGAFSVRYTSDDALLSPADEPMPSAQLKRSPFGFVSAKLNAAAAQVSTDSSIATDQDANAYLNDPTTNGLNDSAGDTTPPFDGSGGAVGGDGGAAAAAAAAGALLGGLGLYEALRSRQ